MWMFVHLTLAVVSVAAAAPAPSLVHIRGTITAASPSSLTVTTDRGTVQVAVSPSTPVAGVLPASTSDIKPNTFIGTANVRGAGTSRALEVVVFPNSMRGTGEGDYAWDLPASSGSSMMTNGTVSHGSSSMMTNGNVTHAAGSGAMTITVAYKGGSQVITVAPGTPIVRVVPGNHSLLKPGAHVFIVAKPGATPVAVRVIAGENGTVPPM